jgi:hypothetical protein
LAAARAAVEIARAAAAAQVDFLALLVKQLTQHQP